MLQVTDPFQLPSLPLSEAATLPEIPSVYFVLDGDEIVYIGRSSNLKQRWSLSYSHHLLPRLLSRTRFKISWLACPDQSMIGEIECALINHFNPPLNRTKGSAVALNKKTISVVVPQEAYNELKAFAESKDWGISQTARYLIEKGLERQKGDSKKD